MAKDQLTFDASGRWQNLLEDIPAAESKTPAPVESSVNSVEEPEEKVYSVAEVVKSVKKQVETKFSEIWIKGEISNFKVYGSGHAYFSLKDEDAQLKSVMFKNVNSRLTFTPENGMEVLVRCRITVYVPRGDLQMSCLSMEPVGAGALQKQFEQLKAKLQKEGLFDKSKKKSLPKHPQKIGVVTSPTGAAIRDILNVLGRRCKRAQVVVIPARVQGAQAAGEVSRGIELANQVGDFDVLIVGRGGGSIEDLWCFNEEVVARAIYASQIPIISAVGHEIDFTIADFVADHRSPTPSAGAEIVAQSEQELNEKLKFYSKSLRVLIAQKISNQKKQLNLLHRGLIDPRKYLQDCMLRCDDWAQRLTQNISQVLKNKKIQSENWTQRLDQIMPRLLKDKKTKVHLQMQLLDSLSPLKVVDRGYAIVRKDGNVAKSIENFKKGESLDVQLADGSLTAKVEKTVKKRGKDEF